MRVRFERVTKRFGAHHAVDGISLDVESGECLVLLGDDDDLRDPRSG